jgi:hypothetical protein
LSGSWEECDPTKHLEDEPDDYGQLLAHGEEKRGKKSFRVQQDSRGLMELGRKSYRCFKEYISRAREALRAPSASTLSMKPSTLADNVVVIESCMYIIDSPTDILICWLVGSIYSISSLLSIR